MKPAPFAYHRPSTRDEVDELLAGHGDRATILAGGQSLVPLLNLRLVVPEHVIDINGLDDEAAEPGEDNGRLTIGPLVRQAAVERSSLVARAAPLLGEAVRHVAHPAIRSRGTVLGSTAHADSAAEIPAALLVLDAEAVLRSKRGERTVPVHELFVGFLQTCLASDEWLVELRLPASDPPGGAVEEFARRHGDYALCGVAAVAAEQTDGSFGVALAFFGIGGVPQRIGLGTLQREALEGDELVAVMHEAALPRLEPVTDVHATASYRLWLAERLGARAVRRAAGLAGSNGSAS